MRCEIKNPNRRGRIVRLSGEDDLASIGRPVGVELLTVIEGEGEAWVAGETGTIKLEPGITIALPAGRVHGFRTVGERPLVTFGIHTSNKRIVDYADPPAAAG